VSGQTNWESAKRWTKADLLLCVCEGAAINEREADADEVAVGITQRPQSVKVLLSCRIPEVERDLALHANACMRLRVRFLMPF